MATPLALSLDANARAKERKRKQLQSARSSHLVKFNVPIVHRKIQSDVRNQNFSASLLNRLSQHWSQQTPGTNRVLHGEPSGDLRRGREVFEQPSTRKRSGIKRLGARLAGVDQQGVDRTRIRQPNDGHQPYSAGGPRTRRRQAWRAIELRK